MSYILEKLGLKQQSCPCLIASKSDAIKFEIHLSCRNLAEEIFGTFHSLTKCEASFDIASGFHAVVVFLRFGMEIYLRGIARQLHCTGSSCHLKLGFSDGGSLIVFCWICLFIPWSRGEGFQKIQYLSIHSEATKHGKLEILKFSSNIQREQKSNI